MCSVLHGVALLEHMKKRAAIAAAAELQQSSGVLAVAASAAVAVVLVWARAQELQFLWVSGPTRGPREISGSSNSNGKKDQISLAQMLLKMKSEHEGGGGSGKQ
jgi:hypothetical protein